MRGRNKSGIHYTQRAKGGSRLLRLVSAIAAFSVLATGALAQVQGPLVRRGAVQPCDSGAMTRYNAGLVSFAYPANWKAHLSPAPLAHQRGETVEFVSDDHECSITVSKVRADDSKQDSAALAFAWVSVYHEPHEVKVRGVEVKDEQGGNAHTALVIGPSLSGFLHTSRLYMKLDDTDEITLELFVPLDIHEQLLNRILKSLTIRSSVPHDQRSARPLVKETPVEISRPAMIDTCGAVNVIGNWQANVSVDVPRVDVDVSFTLRPDGTYSYTAGQGSFVWTAHDGSYSLAQNGGDQYYRCLLTLTPDPATLRMNPQNRYGLMPLQARSLMADRRTTFRVSDSIVPGQLLLFDASLARNGVGMFSLESVR